ncbi:hypothetical protein CHS0354_029606 [Potamilus streckersoni]|uniref:AIG1-type G domain-containing protein n=1 Tax=Potamilus streckersoni TaxID=2493646 RepID=A0AAE0RTJ7_9BIVA|nr:hypothetical protein CHS0354_029606 [Potamilus streckersoni]
MAACGSNEEFGTISDELEEYRVVALGKNGNGKSATGNNFLGIETFISLCSAKSVTENCRCDSAIRFGKRLVYVDTPGFFDIEKPNEIIMKEIIKCKALSSPGPHAFLLIIKVDRFTPEEKNTIDLYEQIFGDEFYNHLIVVFTHKDKLDKSGKLLKQFTSEAPSDLQNVLSRNNNICIAIENEASPEVVEVQMKELFTLVTVVVGLNEGKHYTNTTYENIEKRLLKEEDKQRKTLMDNLTRTINDKKESLKQNNKDVKEEEELLLAYVFSLQSSTEAHSLEEAQSAEAKINKLYKENEQLKYKIIMMKDEIRRIKKESKDCPNKPGSFRENIRQMIESEEGQLVVNFLMEFGPTLLKSGIVALKSYLKK